MNIWDAMSAIHPCASALHNLATESPGTPREPAPRLTTHWSEPPQRFTSRAHSILYIPPQRSLSHRGRQYFIDAMTESKAKNLITAGDTISEQKLEGIIAPILIPDPNRLVHLQLRRFAGCNICNLHLRSFVTRKDEIARAGILEVVVFHSTAEEIRKYESDFPLNMVADPTKHLYREFGVKSSVWSVLNLHILARLPAFSLNAMHWVFRHRRLGQMNPTGGMFGFPADFLIAGDGRVIAVKYGKNADDQWSVDELLTQATRA